MHRERKKYVKNQLTAHLRKTPTKTQNLPHIIQVGANTDHDGYARKQMKLRRRRSSVPTSEDACRLVPKAGPSDHTLTTSSVNIIGFNGKMTIFYASLIVTEVTDIHAISMCINLYQLGPMSNHQDQPLITGLCTSAIRPSNPLDTDRITIPVCVTHPLQAF